MADPSRVPPRETTFGVLRVYGRRLTSQSPAATMQALLRPGVVGRHLKRLVRGYAEPASNAYLPGFSRPSEIAFCSDLLATRPEEADRLFGEIEDGELLEAIRHRYASIRSGAPPLELGRFRIWYAVVRCLRPEVVLETGVHDGLSSAVILQALERNGTGRLVSIDLPSTDLPPTADGPGWLVPEPLRARWTLHVGDARRLLPRVARDLSAIDVFSHDSDHSADHQAFEYEAVRPYLAPGALVLSDQDYPHETALPELARRVAGVHRRVRTVAGDPGLYAGGVRLPGGG